MDRVWLNLADLPRASAREWQTSGVLPKTIYEHEGRNNYLFSLACSDRNRGLDEDEIYERLRVVNASRCSPPLTEDELRAIAHSACRYQAGDPGVSGPSGTDDEHEVDPTVLRTRLSDVQRQLARTRERLREKNRRYWEKSQRDRDERAMLRNPNLRAGEKLSQLVALRDIDSEAHWGRRGPDGMSMITASRVARETGQSDDAVAKHFAIGVQLGGLRHEVRTVPIRVLDPTTGEFRDEPRNATFLGTVQATTNETIRALAVASKPTKKDGTPRGKWGGLHERCPEHPEAGFVVHGYVCCAECGRPLHPQHFVAPDKRPNPHLAESVDESEWASPWLRPYSVQDADLVSTRQLHAPCATSPPPVDVLPPFEPDDDGWGPFLKGDWTDPPPGQLGPEGAW